ncbi:MAG TPA: ABC transporter permease [Longimicrobiaceae bacterium]|nr:ABC transporter permease [Longimicrobiaceae bacterium]
MSSSPRLSALRQLILMRLRTFWREPEALFWTFGFPILMAVGLGLAFREKPPEPSSVAVVRGTVAERYVGALRHSPELSVRLLGPDSAARALRKGAVALVLAGSDSLVIRYDPQRPESRVAHLATDAAVQRAGGGTRPVPVLEDARRQPGSRYIDWLIPGLIGLNLMSTGMWGIGFGMVIMRQKKQLKRLTATPMRRGDFLLAQMIARLIFLVVEIAPIVLFARIAFGVRVRGSFLELGVVVVLGALTFAGLGLLTASRARTVEGVSGIMNVVMMPMFILSGVFFSAARFPDAVQPLIQALPLTALNDAMRAVYNDGLSLTAVPGELAILVAWMLVTFALALKLFRWQ